MKRTNRCANQPRQKGQHIEEDSLSLLNPMTRLMRGDACVDDWSSSSRRYETALNSGGDLAQVVARLSLIAISTRNNL